jgi:hypothetical protein
MIDSNPKSNALDETGSGQNPDNRETNHGRGKADNQNVKRMAIGVVCIGVVGHSILHQHEENLNHPPDWRCDNCHTTKNIMPAA